MNQLSVYATVTDWCYQFGLTDEEKERVSIALDNWVLPMVKTQEVEMLVSPPNLTPGNRMQGNTSFRVLEKKIQMTQLCDKALFQHLGTAGNLLQISTG